MYGHQDENSGPLNILEHLNCDINKMTKNITLAHIDSGNRNLIFSTSQDLGTVTCHGHLVPSDIHQSLYYHIQRDGV